MYINSLFGILIRFRENYVGFISKLYKSVRIPVRDQHCHRFLWRDMKCEENPDTYVITRVNVGDIPSGSIASLALRKAAEMRKEVFPEAIDVIINSSCMDDIINSVAGVEGVCVLTKNITDFLKMGDFHIKEWVISFESTDASIKLQMFEPGSKSEKVLGISWHVKGDYFSFC